MGRPPLPKGKVKDVQLCFRVQPALYRKILEVAKRERKTLAGWVRDTLAGLLRSE